MDLIQKFGTFIRHLRKEKKLTQEELAKLCHLHPTYIGQIERGEKNPTIESTYQICKALEISISKLFEQIDETETGDDSIPAKSYRLLSQYSQEEQELLYNILTSASALISGKHSI